MEAEVDALQEHDAMVFAAGCIWASLKERVLRMKFATQSVRVGGLAAMLALALVSAHVAQRVITMNTAISLVALLSSAVFAAAAIWSALRGSLALIQAASTMAAIYGVALIFVRSTAWRTAQGANARLYEALAAEGLIIWVILLACGIFVLWSDNRAASERV